MKKLILVLTLCLISFVSTQAQKLGDLLEIDGVPAFVFYVDNSGEHGLVMSLPAVSTSVLNAHCDRIVEWKQDKDDDFTWTDEEYETFVSWWGEGKNNLSLQKSEVNIKKLGISSKKAQNNVPLTESERKSIYKDLSTKIGDDGEANAKAIKEYCDEKGLSMKDKFPREYWAASLGEGWFVPGNDELELYANFFLGGVGKSYGKGGVAYIKHLQTLSDNAMVNTVCSMMADMNVMGIISSTFNEDGYYALATKFFAQIWVDIDVCKNEEDECEKAVVAVHKF